MPLSQQPDVPGDNEEVMSFIFCGNFSIFDVLNKRARLRPEFSGLRPTGSVGRVARQWSAKPRTAVRIRHRPLLQQQTRCKSAGFVFSVVNSVVKNLPSLKKKTS